MTDISRQFRLLRAMEFGRKTDLWIADRYTENLDDLAETAGALGMTPAALAFILDRSPQKRLPGWDVDRPDIWRRPCPVEKP